MPIITSPIYTIGTIVIMATHMLARCTHFNNTVIPERQIYLHLGDVSSMPIQIAYPNDKKYSIIMHCTRFVITCTQN